MSNIISVVDVGEEDTFDLEVDHVDHQYYLANGALSSNSHADAYAVISYYCAWLLTHHEEEWLCSYLEAAASNPENKSKASAEIRSMGYEIVPIDVNYADKEWTILPGKKFMPSLLSCKGIGARAIDELVENRPYASIEDMLWDDEGKWRHSKLNKRALEALIKIGGFESIGIVGEGKLFDSYRQMHAVIIESGNDLKKSNKDDRFLGRTNMYTLIEASRGMPEWDKPELAKFQVELLGSLDVGALVPVQYLKKFEEKNVISVDLLESDSTDLCWFVILSAKDKNSKNNKRYVQLEVAGLDGKVRKMFVWGAQDQNRFKTYSVCLAEVASNEFGTSTQVWKLKTLS